MNDNFIKKTIKNENRLFFERIINHIFINSANLNDLSLFHGKMGLIILFIHYSKYSRNSIYEEFAWELLDDVFNEINLDIPINFEFGLCGIGWGIEYLLQNNYLEGDSNMILENIDNKIMELNLDKIKDSSIRSGTKGILNYVFMRLRSHKQNKAKNPFDFLLNLVNNQSIYNLQDLFLELREAPNDDSFLKWNIGIDNGCAGYLLKKIL